MSLKDEPGKPDISLEQLALERYKAKLDFWKFLGGSVFAAIAIASIPPSFQFASAYLENARKERELSQNQASFHDTYVKDFVEKALSQDIEQRIRLATYFANVADDRYKQGWQAYLKALTELRNDVRSEINDNEKKLYTLHRAKTNDDPEVAELIRILDWRYGELNYSRPNRDVVPNPRSAPMENPVDLRFFESGMMNLDLGQHQEFNVTPFQDPETKKSLNPREIPFIRCPRSVHAIRHRVR